MVLGWIFLNLRETESFLKVWVVETFNDEALVGNGTRWRLEVQASTLQAPTRSKSQPVKVPQEEGCFESRWVWMFLLLSFFFFLCVPFVPFPLSCWSKVSGVPYVPRRSCDRLLTEVNGKWSNFLFSCPLLMKRTNWNDKLKWKNSFGLFFDSTCSSDSEALLTNIGFRFWANASLNGWGQHHFGLYKTLKGHMQLSHNQLAPPKSLVSFTPPKAKPSLGRTSSVPPKAAKSGSRWAQNGAQPKEVKTCESCDETSQQSQDLKPNRVDLP